MRKISAVAPPVHRILVIAEPRADPDVWADSGDHGDLVVLAQLAGESCTEFSARAALRMDRLHAAGWRPDTAVLAVGAESGTAVLNARIATVRALVKTLGPDARALVFAASPALPRLARYELYALAQTVAEAAPGLSIRIHTPEETSERELSSRPGSGEHRIALAPASDVDEQPLSSGTSG